MTTDIAVGMTGTTFVSTINGNFAELVSRIVALESGGPAHPSTNSLMIVAFGESGSGGVAPNAYARTWETASRPELQFLNVATLAWQALDIGSNNNIDHEGLTSATHGWELETANACKRLEFDRPVYYVQTGQGGSLIGEWQAAASNHTVRWDKFLTRTTAAKTLLASTTCQYVVWVSLGINDAIAGTTGAAFTAAMTALLPRIKTQLPGCKIMIGKIPPVNAQYDAINTAIDTFSSDTDVQIVSVLNPTMSMVDTNHWDYQGNRSFADRMIKASRLEFTLPALRTTFASSTMTLDGNSVTCSAAGQFAHANETLDFTFDQSVEFEVISGEGMIIALDSDVSEIGWGTADPYYIGAFTNAGAWYWTITSGAIVSSVAIGSIVLCRFRKSGNDLLFETTPDNVTWTTQYTRTGGLSGVSSVRLKFVSAIGACRMRAWCKPNGVGVTG